MKLEQLKSDLSELQDSLTSALTSCDSLSKGLRKAGLNKAASLIEPLKNYTQLYITTVNIVLADSKNLNENTASHCFNSIHNEIVQNVELKKLDEAIEELNKALAKKYRDKANNLSSPYASVYALIKAKQSNDNIISNENISNTSPKRKPDIAELQKPDDDDAEENNKKQKTIVKSAADITQVLITADFTPIHNDGSSPEEFGSQKVDSHNASVDTITKEHASQNDAPDDDDIPPTQPVTRTSSPGSSPG